MKFMVRVRNESLITYEIEGPSEDRIKEVIESGGACGGPNDVRIIDCVHTSIKRNNVTDFIIKKKSL